MGRRQGVEPLGGGGGGRELCGVLLPEGLCGEKLHFVVVILKVDDIGYCTKDFSNISMGSPTYKNLETDLTLSFQWNNKIKDLLIIFQPMKHKALNHKLQNKWMETKNRETRI